MFMLSISVLLIASDLEGNAGAYGAICHWNFIRASKSKLICVLLRSLIVDFVAYYVILRVCR